MGKELNDRIFKLLWLCIEHHKVNDHDELEEIAIEKKVCIAEKHDCFPVDEADKTLSRMPGAITNIANFLRITID